MVLQNMLLAVIVILLYAIYRKKVYLVKLRESRKIEKS